MSHPKFLRAGPEAGWLWLAGLCYCNTYGTDGEIEANALASLCPGVWSRNKVARLAARLVDAQLWIETRSGFAVKSYEDYQETALKTNQEQRKKLERERKRAWRSKRKSEDVPSLSRRTPAQLSPHPDPTRPVLLTSSSSEDSEEIKIPPVAPRGAGDEFPEDFDRRHGDRRHGDRRAPSAKSLLAKGYQERYEKHARDAWMGHAANEREIAQVAAYVERQPDQPAAVRELLDGFFADPWAREHTWPWKRLAKDPAKYRSGALAATSDVQMEKMDRLRTLAYEALRNGDSALHEKLMKEKDALHVQLFGQLGTHS